MSKDTVEKKFITGIDSSGQLYAEVICNDLDEGLRVTAIPETYRVRGAEPAVRIQIRSQSGKLLPGPEFGSSYLPDVVWALATVARELKREA